MTDISNTFSYATDIRTDNRKEEKVQRALGTLRTFTVEQCVTIKYLLPIEKDIQAVSEEDALAKMIEETKNSTTVEELITDTVDMLVDDFHHQARDIAEEIVDTALNLEPKDIELTAPEIVREYSAEESKELEKE